MHALKSTKRRAAADKRAKLCQNVSPEVSQRVSGHYTEMLERYRAHVSNIHISNCDIVYFLTEWKIHRDWNSILTIIIYSHAYIYK